MSAQNHKNWDDKRLYNDQDSGSSDDETNSRSKSESSPNPARFQELAIMLIQALKGLMLLADSNEALKDKEVEARLNVIKEILGMCKDLSSQVEKQF